jgi:hypothetical protein
VQHTYVTSTNPVILHYRTPSTVEDDLFCQFYCQLTAEQDVLCTEIIQFADTVKSRR